MAGVNKVIILGHMGRAETSYTNSGMAVCKFSLATSEKKKSGEAVTAWHRCTAFGKTGEAIQQYVVKGQQLYVEGKLQYGEYEKDGIKRYTTDIIVNQFSFVGKKDDHGNQGQQPNQNYQQGSGFYNQPDDDDMPF